MFFFKTYLNLSALNKAAKSRVLDFSLWQCSYFHSYQFLSFLTHMVGDKELKRRPQAIGIVSPTPAPLCRR